MMERSLRHYVQMSVWIVSDVAASVLERSAASGALGYLLRSGRAALTEEGISKSERVRPSFRPPTHIVVTAEDAYIARSGYRGRAQTGTVLHKRTAARVFVMILFPTCLGEILIGVALAIFSGNVILVDQLIDSFLDIDDFWCKTMR